MRLLIFQMSISFNPKQWMIVARRIKMSLKDLLGMPNRVVAFTRPNSTGRHAAILATTYTF